jgi:hypothetical protein
VFRKITKVGRKSGTKGEREGRRELRKDGRMRKEIYFEGRKKRRTEEKGGSEVMNEVN